MSFQFYKVIHMLGLFLLFSSFGGMITHRMRGGDKKFAEKRSLMLLHGFGLACLLVAGFGLLARLNLHATWPGWVWAKIGIWLILGVSPALIFRKNKVGLTEWLMVIALGGCAAYLANFKPF